MTFFDECQAVLEKFPRIAEDLFYIRTQEEGFAKIVPNNVQLHYHNDRLKRGFGARDLILKDRKRGFTTWKILELLSLMIFGPRGLGAGVVVHEAETATRVFKIFDWAYSRLPPEIRKDRVKDEDRRDAIDIGGSTCYVYSAGSHGVGRSETLHWLLCDEVAWWKDPDGTTPGLFDAVPRFGHIAQVSTPNGRDNYFYDAYMAAREGVSDTKAFFYEWWWGPENALPLREGQRIIRDEEEDLITEIARKDGFDLSDEQINWRRSKKANPGTAKTFPQEHPEDDETCFMVSGSPLIDPLLLAQLIRQADVKLSLEKIWLPGDGESITWKRSTGKYPFIVSADPAEGKTHGDWSVISTWQLAPDALYNVKREKLKCNTDELAHRIIATSQEYQDAIAIVERNNMGALVVKKLTDLGFWNQYFRYDREDGIEETDHPGWRTDVKSKAMMVGEFVDSVNAGDIISYDVELWGQMMNVTRDEYGRPQFPRKKHDDIVIAAMMANMAREQARRRSGGGAQVVSYA